MDTTWREDLAWAAGFCDGECHIRANWLHGRFWQVRVDITQADRRVLDRFRRVVMGIGKVYGPYPHVKPEHRDRYQYSAVGSHAQAIIAFLWGWLDVVKREQARDALLKVRTTATHIRPGLQPMCRRGHLMDEQNTLLYTQGVKSWVSRRCRRCAADHTAAHRVRRYARAMLTA